MIYPLIKFVYTSHVGRAATRVEFGWRRGAEYHISPCMHISDSEIFTQWKCIIYKTWGRGVDGIPIACDRRSLVSSATRSRLKVTALVCESTVCLSPPRKLVQRRKVLLNSWTRLSIFHTSLHEGNRRMIDSQSSVATLTLWAIVGRQRAAYLFFVFSDFK